MTTGEGLHGPTPWMKVELPPAGEIPSRCDVVVVGGTPSAWSAATTSAELGSRVVLVPTRPLEVEPFLVCHGVLGPGVDDPPAHLMEVLGDSGREVWDFAAEAVTFALDWLRWVKRDVRFSLTPLYRVACSDVEAHWLKQSVELPVAEVLGATWIDGEDAWGNAGFRTPPAGWRGAIRFWGGIFEPGLTYHRLVKDALAAGVILAPPLTAPVRGAINGVEVVTSGGVVEAEVSIVAAGVDLALALPDLRSLVNPARVQISWTRPDPLWRLGYPWIGNGGFEVGRFAPDGGYLLGGFRYADVELGMDLRKPELLPRVSQVQRKWLDHTFGPSVEIRTEWTWEIDVSCDNLALAGAVPGQPRQMVIGGLMGHDLSLGLLLGRRMATHLAGGSAPTLPAILALHRML